MAAARVRGACVHLGQWRGDDRSPTRQETLSRSWPPWHPGRPPSDENLDVVPLCDDAIALDRGAGHPRRVPFGDRTGSDGGGQTTNRSFSRGPVWICPGVCGQRESTAKTSPSTFARMIRVPPAWGRRCRRLGRCPLDRRPARDGDALLSAAEKALENPAMAGMVARAAPRSPRAGIVPPCDPVLLLDLVGLTPRQVTPDRTPNLHALGRRGSIAPHGFDPAGGHLLRPGDDVDRHPAHRARRGRQRMAGPAHLRGRALAPVQPPRGGREDLRGRQAQGRVLHLREAVLVVEHGSRRGPVDHAAALLPRRRAEDPRDLLLAAGVRDRGGGRARRVPLLRLLGTESRPALEPLDRRRRHPHPA